MMKSNLSNQTKNWSASKIKDEKMLNGILHISKMFVLIESDSGTHTFSSVGLIGVDKWPIVVKDDHEWL